MYNSIPLHILILEDMYERNGSMASKDRIAVVYGVKYSNEPETGIYRELEIKDDDQENYMWVPAGLVRIVENNNN